MEENEARLIYMQDGVTLKTAHPNFTSVINTIGSLSIFEHPEFKVSIDWKQNNFIMFDTLLESEWTVVDEERTDSNETQNHNDGNYPKIITIMLEDIDKIISRNKTVTFITKRDGIGTKFYISNGSTDKFIRQINLYCETKAVGRDSLQITKANIRRMPVNTMGSPEMFEDCEYTPPWRTMGNIVRSLKERPVETAIVAGTKVWDAIIGSNISNVEEDDPSEHEKNDISSKNSEEYEVVRQKQNLPPRPNISRGIPLSERQWLDFQDNAGRIVDVDAVKRIIFRGGIHPSLRREVWKYLLNYYPWDMTCEERRIFCKQREQEYFTMKSQWKTITAAQESRFFDFHERKSLVEKDVNRTDRSWVFYAGDDNPNLNTLFDILLTYVMYNFDLGYVQGMSDLLSPIFCLLDNEVDAFWCFVGFMDRVHTNFDIDQAGMKHQLQQLFELLSFINPDLTQYLSKHESENMYFCFRWLLVLFKREFSHSDIMRLWEVIWTGLPCENFHLLMCIAILDTEKSVIIERNYGFSKILKHINDLSMTLNLENVLIRAEAIYEQLTNAINLPNNIRSILGFKLLSEDNLVQDNEVPDATNEMISLQESVCLDNIKKSDNKICLEPGMDEVTFQRSLELNHL